MAEAAKLSEREQIARIINPHAFRDLDFERQWCQNNGKNLETWASGTIKSCEAALAKADAILALSSSSDPDAVRTLEPSDDFINAFLKAEGSWVEAYEAPRESGVAVDNDMSQSDADAFNAEAHNNFRRAWKAAVAAAGLPSPTVTETEVILDAINDRSPRARQAIDLLLYKFDVYPRPALTEKRPSNQGGRK